MQTPNWLPGLFQTVTNATTLLPPECWRCTYVPPRCFTNPHPHWLVRLFPVAVKLKGGHADGAVLLPSYKLDLQQFLSHFDEVSALSFERPESYNRDLDGLGISLRGRIAGDWLQLRLLEHAPADENQPQIMLASQFFASGISGLPDGSAAQAAS